MTTLLDRFETSARVETSPVTTTTTAAQKLRLSVGGVRVSFTWMGTRKALSTEQRDRAAEQFDAEGQCLSAAKRLIDTKHPAFKAVTAVKGSISEYWKSLTLPFPEPGLRLIRQDRIEAFAERMGSFKAELDDAVKKLDECYWELKSTARDQLGRLFCEDDYPSSLRGLFDVVWEFPSVEPPDYLMQLNPALYEQERARVAARFEEAVALTEQAFAEEFGKLVSHLCERISSGDKIFRDSAVNNLSEFFERFRSLNVGSNDQLDKLVSTAQQAVHGIAPQDLRDSGLLRERVANQLGQIQASMDALLVDRPRRRILRSGGEA